ncbi:MAG: hypothetical protein BWZ03_00814 [bacterium ADurb.BinA186]|nr:MAG: hypothetical protein BWZ03_00814 [bacterium ADurb.BinA186]
MLIELGSSDDALRYYAYLKATPEPQIFELKVHENAQLLDMVRLKRSMKVKLVCSEYCYDALLKIKNNGAFVEILECFNKEPQPCGIFFTT